MSSHIFDSLRTLKVLVVPVGENSLFDAHFDLISGIKYVTKEEIQPAFSSKGNTNAAFKDFKWCDGNVVFEYLRYDVDMGTSSGDYVDSSQRVMMVVGLVNHPEFVDSTDNIEEELAFFTKNHPHLALRRLVVFNHDTSLLAAGNKAGKPLVLKPLPDDPQSLEICPPEGECNGRSLIETYLRTVMTHAAAKIFGVFLREMQSCEECKNQQTFPRWLATAMKMGGVKRSPSSQTASREATGNGGVDDKKIGPILDKQVLAGRLRKFMGDLCLQVCSPVDALGHYVAAVAACKTHTDTLWHAGALEGYAAAVLTFLDQSPAMPLLEDTLGKDVKTMLKAKKKKKSVAGRVFGVGGSMLSTVVRAAAGAMDDTGADNPPTSSAHEQEEESMELKAVRLAHEKCIEALAVYSAFRGDGGDGKSAEEGKGPVSADVRLAYREAGCALRLAEMLEEIGSGLEAGSTPSDRHQLISDYVMRAISVPGMSPYQRVEITARGALVFRRAGLKRKYALLLYMAALMSAESGKTHTAHILIQKCCKQYGAAVDAGAASNCWPKMRVQLLAHAAHMAKETGDLCMAANSLSAMVRVTSDLADRQQQQLHAWTLAGRSRAHGHESTNTHQVVRPLTKAASSSSISYFSASDRKRVATELMSKVYNWHGAPEFDAQLAHPGVPLPHGLASSSRLIEKNLQMLSLSPGRSAASDAAGRSGGDPGPDSFADNSKSPLRVPFHRSGLSLSSTPALCRSQSGSYTASVTVTSQSAPFSSPLFSTPSILGISKNTPHRRHGGRDNEPKGQGKRPSDNSGHSHILASDSVGIMRAQLQRYQNLSTTASDAANYLTSMILPDSVDDHSSFSGDVDAMKLAAGAKHAPGRNADGLRKQVVNLPGSAMGAIRSNTSNLSSKLSTMMAAPPTPPTPPPPQPGVVRKRSATAVSAASASSRSSSGRPPEGSIATGADNATGASEKGPLQRYVDSLACMLFEGMALPADQQEEVVALLEQLGREVPPDTCLELPVWCCSVRPLPLVGAEAPVKVSPEEQRRWEAAVAELEEKNRVAGQSSCKADVSEAADARPDDAPTKSPLFYDPFAAKRARMEDRVSVLWSVNSPCSAVVVFRNPLLAPLFLSSVTLVASGLNHIATPRSVLLPPRAEQVVVELSVTPLAEGTLRIEGVSVCMFNATCVFPVDIGGEVSRLSSLSSPWEYPYRAKELGATKKQRQSHVNDMGIATNEVTVVPASPSLDLVPTWDVKALRNDINQGELLRTIGENGTDNHTHRHTHHHHRHHHQHDHMHRDADAEWQRVVGLRICRGERRVETVHAVTQAQAITAVGVGDNADGAADSAVGDFRVSIQQFECHGHDRRGQPVVKKTTFTARDFEGPLKSANISSTRNCRIGDLCCRLVRCGEASGEDRSPWNSRVTFPEVAATLPLTLEFSDMPEVLAVRIDIDTVDSSLVRSAEMSTDRYGSGDRQIYMRRSSLYVQILPAPSVELLAISRLCLSANVAQPPPNTDVDTADFLVLKIRNASRQAVAVALSRHGACRAIADHVNSAAQELQTQGPNTPLFSPPKHVRYADAMPFTSPRDDRCATPHSRHSELSSPLPGGVSEFVELVPPECTRNVIVSLLDLQSQSQSSPKEDEKLEVKVDGRDVTEGLFWAMHSPLTAVAPVLGLSASALAAGTADDAYGLGWTGSCGSGSIRCGSLVRRRQPWGLDSAATPSPRRSSRNEAAGLAKPLSRGPSLPAARPLAITAAFASADSDGGVVQLKLMRFYELQLRCIAQPPGGDNISGGLYDVSVVIAKLSLKGTSGLNAVVFSGLDTAAQDGPWHTRGGRKKQLDEFSDTIAVSGQSRFQLHVHEDQPAQNPPLHFCFLEGGTFSIQVFARLLPEDLPCSYSPISHKTPIIQATSASVSQSSGTAWCLSCEVTALVSST